MANIRNVIALLFSVFLLSSVYAASEKTDNNSIGLDANQIEKLTGAKGHADQQEKVFKVSIPRNDLKVTANGVKLIPAMGLTSWAAFKKVGDHVMVMGDLVLTENQVNTVMSEALNNGLHVTALHNHFFWETPRVMFMHIEGMDSADKLATSVGKVFAAIKTTANKASDFPDVNIDPAKTNLNTSKIDTILGTKGALKDGFYKVVVGRTTTMDGHKVGNAMGVNTWAAFVGSDDQAIVDGDFAMHESELQNVLIALRKAGIDIVAIHQHMIGEQPRIIFLHYWGIGSAESLAKGLKAALAMTKESNGTK